VEPALHRAHDLHTIPVLSASMPAVPGNDSPVRSDKITVLSVRNGRFRRRAATL
jgi:hypothetical protein